MKKLIVCLIITASFSLATTVFAQKKSAVLNHIALYVVDLKKSVAFYQNIIQIDTVPEPFHDGKHAWFRVGENSTLHLIEGAKEPVVHEKNHHMCFSVVSLEDFISRLEKEKIFYTNLKGDGKTPHVRVDGVKQIYLKDPDGYWLEINNEKY
jgi:lactoylglutathione lyase